MNNNPFAIFECSSTATFEEVRNSYFRLAKRYHPDKPGGSHENFQLLNQAWEALKMQQELHSSPPQVVDLDEMIFCEKTQCFSLACRCGDTFLVTCLDLEDNINTFPCPSCSLSIQVHFERIDEEENGNN